MSWGEQAPDYEAFVRRVLPASHDHCLRGMRLPLTERAQLLRTAAGLVGCHLLASTLLCGTAVRRCGSLLPLRGGVCAHWPSRSSQLATR